jgi:hypothetical protein
MLIKPIFISLFSFPHRVREVTEQTDSVIGSLTIDKLQRCFNKRHMGYQCNQDILPRGATTL